MLLLALVVSAQFTITGPWEIQVAAAGARPQSARIAPPALLTVTAEKYASIPVFNPKAGGWVRGAQLVGVKAQETTSPHLLDAASFVLRAGPEADSPAFVAGADYELDPAWGTFGRLAGSRIRPDQEVYASYRHAQMRLDAVVLTAANAIAVRQGRPRAAAPSLPELQPGDRHLGNVFVPGRIDKLEPEHLFPILETAYPEQPIAPTPTIERLTRRLNAGQRLKILAWGDSVTDGAYLQNREAERWQEQFAARLRQRFPKARIELVTEAWGGRNTGSYLAEPPGSRHNYQEMVLAVKPDLIISEFVNDAGLKPAQVEERYGRLLRDFKEMGAEWIILTPHYVRPDWMQLTSQREIDADPRPYVQGLRQFAATHDVALADASLRYGRLWRQGIPYNVLMLNAINHPDARGLRLFADALMALFP
jgi:lysophospholipase L1-like esterase